MDKDSILAAAKEQVSAAREIESLLSSKGWAVYRKFLQNKIAEIRRKDNYKSLHELNADRKLIKILVNLEHELKDVIGNADTAYEIISKLDNQTSEDEGIPLDPFETEI